MATNGTQDNISPWTSGSWHFNPRKIGLVGPGQGRNARNRNRHLKDRRGQSQNGRKFGFKRFGLLPEQELFRLGYIVLFAFSGFVLTLLAITLMS